MISLLEALAITEDPNTPFSIRFVTYDESRNSGGEIIELNNCVRTGASHNMKLNDTISVKQLKAGKHPYTVHVHFIQSINNQEIYF